MRRMVFALAPFMVLAALNIWAYANKDRFPSPMATHWGIDGRADGFASLETHLLGINLGLGTVAAIWLIAFLIRLPSAIRTFLLLIVGYIFVVLFVLMAQTLLQQLDLADPSQSRIGIELLLLLLPLLALFPIVLAWPKVSIGESVDVSLRGIRFLSLPLSVVSAARSSTAKAADFGGWGLRYANKTTAFVPRSGPALELELANGSKILIRVDNPDQLVQEIERRSAR